MYITLSESAITIITIIVLEMNPSIFLFRLPTYYIFFHEINDTNCIIFFESEVTSFTFFICSLDIPKAAISCVAEH